MSLNFCHIIFKKSREHDLRRIQQSVQRQVEACELCVPDRRSVFFSTRVCIEHNNLLACANLNSVTEASWAQPGTKIKRQNFKEKTEPVAKNQGVKLSSELLGVNSSFSLSYQRIHQKKMTVSPVTVNKRCFVTFNHFWR